MSEEVINRVDEMVRKNNIKYKGKSLTTQIKKSRKLTSRPSSSMKSITRKNWLSSMQV